METINDDFESAFAEITSANRAGEQAPASDTPAPTAPAEPQGQATPAPTTPEQPQAGEAAEAPASMEELQRKMRELAHRERSSANRISAFAQENNTLRKQLDELKAKLQEREAAPAASAPAEPQASVQQQLEDVLSNAPDLEAAVKRRIEAMVNPFVQRATAAEERATAAERAAAELRRDVDPIRADREQQAMQSTWEALDSTFSPEWRKDIKSEAFTSWLERAPAPIQELYQKGVTPAESGAVLRLYYAENGITRTAASNQPAADTNTQRLRLAAGVNTGRAPIPRSGPADDDFDGHFALANRSRRQA